MEKCSDESSKGGYIRSIDFDCVVCDCLNHVWYVYDVYVAYRMLILHYQSINNQLRPLDYVVYLFFGRMFVFCKFSGHYTIPLTLWHSNFVKSFLSLISKKQNFEIFEKKFISRDIAFSVGFFRVWMCIFSIAATPFNLHL